MSRRYPVTVPADTAAGKPPPRRPEGRARRRAIFAPVAAAEEAFSETCTLPMPQAAADPRLLVPATDLPALLAKICVMQELELDELAILDRPVLKVLAEDVERHATAASALGR